MSRRRGEKQLRILLFEWVALLMLLLSIKLVSTEGNVGCLYSDSLCDAKTEWCHNDSAFGRCLYKYAFSPENLYRYQFKYEDLENLKQILEQLRQLGFTWKDLYTQCIVQTQLYTIRTGVQYDVDAEICDRVLKQEIADPIRLLRYGQPQPQPQPSNRHVDIGPSLSAAAAPVDNEGIIKYAPDDQLNPVPRPSQQNTQTQAQTHAVHAQAQRNPDYESELLNQLRTQSSKLKSEVFKKNFKSTSSRYRGTPLYLPLHNRDKLKPTSEQFVDIKPSFNKISHSNEGNGGSIDLDENGRDNDDVDDDDDDDNNNNNNGDEINDGRPDVYDQLLALQKVFAGKGQVDQNAKVYSEAGAMTIGKKPEYENNVYDKILDQYGGKIFGFQRSERLDVKKPGPYYKVNNYAFGNMNTHDQPKQDGNDDRNLSNGNGFKRRVMKDVFSDTYPTFQNPSYEYVPGNYKHSSYVSRLLTLDQNPSYVTIETNHDLNESAVSQLVGKLTKLFNFPPGIFSQRKFEGNKVTFKIKQNMLNPSAAEIKRLIENSNPGDLTDGIHITNVYLGKPKDEHSPTNSPAAAVAAAETEDVDQYAIVDVDYAYIHLKEPLRNKADGQRIIDEIEKLLKLPENTLYEVNTAVSEILFKVKPNAQNLNASELAKRIDSLRSRIKNDLKIDITSVGIGDKDKLPTATRLSHADDSLYMLTFIVCGVIGAVLVSAVALYCTKKQSRLKDKLHKLLPSDKDFGKDYQDLCRTKMTRKSSQETASAAVAAAAAAAAAGSGQRITSLSRESDNSPSSRSSTSSWSEEPMTNMDITTGHMVLAYMEDHLNNKARLDTEWAALCAYDADPCSVAIAQLKENIRKNRYVNALPYDHARVILNALSNVNGSDYINASTITDHDPRNAAYIATQGPLENTVDDFWQMIWEQGCVVIVMLTRLVENDTSMCYRYWPMDGSHLYDIYEVHLVSEHIWCDDFLVRSFYLKNVKTTETRTVTQFHFLTWPEGGIPSATKPLLEFRRKVNKSFRGRSCPIVVHCSDGVGRTGSYLLLDMVLNRISKGAKEIDIAATLEHIRDQRAGAVCTKQQFQFVLSAVAEEVQAALRALPQQQSTQQDQSTGDNVAPGPAPAPAPTADATPTPTPTPTTVNQEASGTDQTAAAAAASRDIKSEMTCQFVDDGQSHKKLSK